MASFQQILYTYVLNPSWISSCIFVLYPFFADYYMFIFKIMQCVIYKFKDNYLHSDLV